MSRPHLASLAEDAWNEWLGRLLRKHGWRDHVLPYAGYGGPDFLRVLGRVVLAPPGVRGAGAGHGGQRGWRHFRTAEVLDAEVTVVVDGHEHTTWSDRSGNVDVRVPNPGLSAGWHEVILRTPESEASYAPVHVVAADETFGLISDIDDTVLRTLLPRPLLAAYNTFVIREQSRRPVPGMATLYGALLADHPGAPTVYVSTGAWNTAGALARFLSRHGFPRGPLLLTDWGPTNSGWFRSGQDHKRACLRRLAADFPQITWVLVGDDGQRDPDLYAEFAREHPDRVRAIAIRQLDLGERVVALGPVESGEERLPVPVPVRRAADGFGLAALLGVPLRSGRDV